MGAIRRLYLYVVSTVSLFALAAGIEQLVEQVLGVVRDAIGPGALADESSRGQLSLAIALIVVGAPVWAFHRWLINRGMRAPDPLGIEDRMSALRAAYYALVAGVALYVWATSAVSFVELVGQPLIGFEAWRDWTGPLAWTLTAAPLWFLALRTREREIRAVRLHGAAAAITRLYRYGALFGMLVMALGGAIGLSSAVLEAIVGRELLGSDRNYLAQQVLSAAAAIIVGGCSWWYHRSLADAAIRDREVLGQDDSASRIRGLNDNAVVLLAAGWVCSGLIAAVRSAIVLVVGGTSASTLDILHDVIGPVLTMAPVAAVGVWLVRNADRTAGAVGEAHVANLRRGRRLVVSALGLLLASIGAGQLLAFGIEQAAGTSDIYAEEPAERLAWGLALSIVGLASWLPAWRLQLAARRREIAGEATAPLARVHLYLVVGVAAVVAVPMAVLVIYRLLDGLLGAGLTGAMLRDLALPLGSSLVAVVIGVAHARMLIADQRHVAAASPAEPPVTWAAAANGGETAAIPAASPASARLDDATEDHEIGLVLHLPGGVDPEAAMADLRAQLPVGARLDEAWRR